MNQKPTPEEIAAIKSNPQARQGVSAMNTNEGATAPIDDGGPAFPIPPYCNMGGLEQLDGSEWIQWEDENGNDIEIE